MTAPAPPILFCPRCDTWLDGRSKCPACDWEAPIAGAAPGAERWRIRLPNTPVTPYTRLAAGRDHYFICTERDIAGRGRQGVVYALQAASGDIIWQHELTGPRVAREPVLHQGLLLIAAEDTRPMPTGEENELVALDANTGAEKWRFDVPAHSLSSPAILGDRLFFPASNGRGYYLAAEDGALKWENSGLPSWAAGRPAAAADAFFIGGWTNRLTRIEASDGGQRVLYEAAGEKNWLSTPPAAFDGRLFVVSWDGRLVALDAGSGELLWSRPAGRGITVPPAAGPLVYVSLKEPVSPGGAREYAIHAYDPLEGELIWRFAAPSHFRAPLLVHAGLIIAGCDDGQIYALDAIDGALQWQLEAGEKVRCAPAVSGATLGFCLLDGVVAAIDWRPAVAPAELLPAETYRASESWEMAGLSALLAGEPAAAADDLLRAGQPFRAAQLYAHLGRHTQAAQAYSVAGRHRRAAAMFSRADDNGRAAEEWTAAGEHLRAGELYEALKEPALAAEAYERAGAMTQAAVCHARAGNHERAARIYLALKQPLPAAQLYAQAGRLERAVAVLREAEMLHEAAALLAEAGQRGAAAQLLLDAGQPEAAAAVWQAANRHDEAARVYEQAGRWPDAAASWLEAGRADEAARCYEQAGDLWQAARLYRKQGQLKRALELYTQLKALDWAARVCEELGDWPAAAAIYRAMNPPDRENAARCYIEAGDWERAAQQYEKGELWDKAADGWRQAGDLRRAAGLLTQLKRFPEAAQLLEEAGDYSAAAELWRHHGDLEQTARLYELSGESHKVLDLLTESGNWKRVVILAHELDEFEREAEACLILAEEASAAERRDLYLAAAQAYERAAVQQEAIGREAHAIAGLWEKAATYYDIGSDDPEEKVAWCRRELSRLRRWPIIAVEVESDGALVAGRHSMLRARVKNVGFGQASAIIIRTQSKYFEGDLSVTQELHGLRPGSERPLNVRIRPHPDASGSVPLDMEVSCTAEDGQNILRKIRGQVTVLEPGGSQYPTPLPGATGNYTIVYTEKAEFFTGEAKKVEGDNLEAGSQKGDRVDVRRPGLRGGQPAGEDSA